MKSVERRSKLLTMEGTGFSKHVIVKTLSREYSCSERTVYNDFQNRGEWQPSLQGIVDPEKALLKILNRYEQIFRKCSLKFLQSRNESIQLGALKLMVEINGKIVETVLLPDLLRRLNALEEKVEKQRAGRMHVEQC